MPFSPAWIMILGGVITIFLPAAARTMASFIIPVLTLWQVALAPDDIIVHNNIGGFRLNTFFNQDYSLIFATAFCLIALAGSLYHAAQIRKSELCLGYIHAGAAIGILYAGDLTTIFIFMQIMVLSGMGMIWFKDESGKAGLRYAYMNFSGGVLMLCGITMHMLSEQSSGLASFNRSEPGLNIPGAMLLSGLLINTLIPTFNIRRSDPFSKSSPFSSLFVSSFGNKVSIFVMLGIFAAESVLIYIGIAMSFYGIICALAAKESRRVFYHSVTAQTGLMITGIGIGTETAIAGVAAFAFCQMIFMALLFLSSETTLRRTKFTDSCMIIAAASACAVPFFSGFVSLPLIIAEAHNYDSGTIGFIAMIICAGTILTTGIKFPFMIFFDSTHNAKPHEQTLQTKMSLAVLAAFCFLPAIFPADFYSLLLPVKISHSPYNPENIILSLKLLLPAAAVFFVINKLKIL